MRGEPEGSRGGRIGVKSMERLDEKVTKLKRQKDEQVG